MLKSPTYADPASSLPGAILGSGGPISTESPGSKHRGSSIPALLTSGETATTEISSALYPLHPRSAGAPAIDEGSGA